MLAVGGYFDQGCRAVPALALVNLYTRLEVQGKADIGETAQSHVARPIQYLGNKRAGLAQPPGKFLLRHFPVLHCQKNILGDVVDQLFTSKSALLMPVELFVRRVE